MNTKEENILKSALEMFVHKGFHGASTSAIAANAEVSNGTLFHYYRSKDALIQTLHQFTKSEQINSIMLNIDEESDPKEKLRLIWNQAIHWAIKNEEKYRFLQEYKYSPYKRNHKGNFDEFKTKFRDLVEKGIQQKQIRFLPDDFIFDITLANIYGMIEYLGKNPVKFRTPEFMKQAFEIFWSSLKMD